MKIVYPEPFAIELKNLLRKAKKGSFLGENLVLACFRIWGQVSRQLVSRPRDLEECASKQDGGHQQCSIVVISITVYDLRDLTLNILPCNVIILSVQCPFLFANQ